MFDFNPEFLIRDEEISHGLQSVFPYRKHSTDDKWAIQIQKAQDHSELISIFHGIFLNAKCEHPGIVPVTGFHFEPAQPSGWNIYTKIPRIEQTLKNLIQEYSSAKKRLSAHQIIKIFHNLIWGLEYMHNKRIVHCNISSSNIVVDRYGIARLMDMALAVQVENLEESESPKGFMGASFLSVSSELGKSGLKNALNLYQDDIWNLGVAVAELCIMKGELINKRLDALEKERAITETLNIISIECGVHLAKILKDILDSNPENRKTATEVRENLEKYFLSELKTSWEPLLEHAKLFETKKGDEESLEMVIAEEPNRLKPIKKPVENSQIREGFIKMKEEENRMKMTNSILKSNLTISIANSVLEEKKEEENSKISTEVLDQRQRLLSMDWREIFSLEIHKEWRIKPIDESKITNDVLQKFMNYLPNNDKVKLSDCQALQLDFSGCLNLNDVGLDGLGIHIVQKFKHLKLLALDLSWCEKITDQGVQKFSTSVFQNINLLKDVSITLAECTKITNDGAKYISDHISQNLKELECLNLNFYGCSQIGNRGLEHLGRNLTKNKRLQKLTLRFNGCINITDEALKSFGEFVRLHLKDLIALTLDFEQCSKISGTGLARLSDSLFQNKNKLTYLNLNFSRCPKINDLGLQQFSRNLGQYIKTLHSLMLAFEECSDLTDEGVERLFSEACIPQSELEELHLNFINCGQMNGSGLKQLGTLSKENNSKLKEITIYFNGCNRINEGLKNELREELAKFIGDVDLQ